MSAAASPPRATVVITTHNRPDFARRAVDSALAQTLDGVEVVVVDDGSEPPFELGRDDARVLVVRRDRAGGASAARNEGLRAASGEWITFLDDDDVLVPEMLEHSLAVAAASSLPEPVAVMSAVTVLDVGGTPAQTLVPPAALSRGEDFVLEGRGAAGRAANSIVAPTAVMRAIGGWDEQLEAFQHDDLGLRLNHAASIAGSNDPVYLMTTHRDARVSGRWGAIPGDMERTLAKHPDAFARHRAAHARFMGITAYYHVKAGHWAPAVRWGLRSVARDPRQRRTWFFLGAALTGPYVHRAYRVARRPESSVPFSTLTRRRARKYARRLGNHPRALIGATTAPVTRAMIRRFIPRATFDRTRSVLVVCVYRVDNAAHVIPLVREATARGWEIRLWALDQVAPSLEAVTVGVSSGAKFPLLNGLIAADDTDRFDWIVVADDDVAYDRGSTNDLLTVAEAAGLDLVQPAHTELSHRENEIAVRRPLVIARQTMFVEIGPLFAVRRPWSSRVVPFPAEHAMGWGIELEWSDLVSDGANLGIVDAVPVRHLHPVGADYGKQAEAERLRELVRARGLTSFRDIQRTLAAWRPWRSSPPWMNQRRRRSPGQ